MSERQTASLAELRNKQPSGDEDSLHYADAGQTKNEAADEFNGEDVYEDTNEDFYEEVGTAPSAAPNQQSKQPTQDVDYEISAAAFPSTPASAPGWYSWLFEIFEFHLPLPLPQHIHTHTAVKHSEIPAKYCHADYVAVLICLTSFPWSG